MTPETYISNVPVRLLNEETYSIHKPRHQRHPPSTPRSHRTPADTEFVVPIPGMRLIQVLHIVVLTLHEPIVRQEDARDRG